MTKNLGSPRLSFSYLVTHIYLASLIIYIQALRVCSWQKTHVNLFISSEKLGPTPQSSCNKNVGTIRSTGALNLLSFQSIVYSCCLHFHIWVQVFCLSPSSISCQMSLFWPGPDLFHISFSYGDSGNSAMSSQSS